ncbi:hypothetical protein, partial [Micrococcus luteus]
MVHVYGEHPHDAAGAASGAGGDGIDELEVLDPVTDLADDAACGLVVAHGHTCGDGRGQLRERGGLGDEGVTWYASH